jgi:hypothetical protein
MTRLIYEKGRQVGPDPTGFYVYLWRHGEVDRYVGKGVNSRWAAHAKPNPKPDRSKSDWRKNNYFCEHLLEMTCFIIAEGLDEATAAAQEVTEIDARGLEINGAGTLLNARGGSVYNGSRGTLNSVENLGVLARRWRKLKRREYRITPNALLRRAGLTLTGNPKKPGGRGTMSIDLYPPPGETMTVEEMYAKGRANGFPDTNQHGHLAWDFVHGFIDLALPEGEDVMPGYILPTKELLERTLTPCGLSQYSRWKSYYSTGHLFPSADDGSELAAAANALWR